jgi:hypothetical protein
MKRKRIAGQPRARTKRVTNEIVAYAYRGGQIGFATPTRNDGVPDGTLFIARGDAELVRATVSGLARRAYDNKTLIVPGCPEANDDTQALEFFKRFATRVQNALKHHVGN